MDLTKLKNGKSWNANHIVRDIPMTAFSVGWQNYLDSGLNWSNIDCILNPVVSGFEVFNSPFYFKAPLRSTGYAQMISNTRFDVFDKSQITSQEFSQTIKCIGIDSVIGQLFDLKGNGRNDAVLYKNAYNSSFAGDLIYYVQHGRAPRLQKLVKFNSAPATDISIEFEIEYSGRTELSPRTLEQDQTRQQARDLWNTALKRGDTMDSQGGFYIRSWDETQKRGIGIKDTFIWDSSVDDFGNSKKQAVRSYLQWISGNKYKLVKIIPKSFFVDAVFPVYTDTVSTFYPDASPESTSVDGDVRMYNAAAWSQFFWDWVHDYSTGVAENRFYSRPWSKRFTPHTTYIWRAFLLFDTSAIPDMDTINSANIDLYVFNKFIENPGDNPFMRLVQTSPASNTAIVSDDFDQCGAIDNPAAGATDTLISGITINQYTTIPLNVTGLSWIDKTGITKLGIREGNDAVDQFNAGWIDDDENSIIYSTSEEVGTSQDPFLTIDHGAGGSAPLFKEYNLGKSLINNGMIN